MSGHHWRTHLPCSLDRSVKRLGLLVSTSVACRCERSVSTSGLEAEREAFVGAEAVGGEAHLHVVRVGEEGRGRGGVSTERPQGFRRGLDLEGGKRKKYGSVIEGHFLVCVLGLETGQRDHLVHDLQIHFSTVFSLFKEELWKIHTVPNNGSLKKLTKKRQVIRGNSCRELGGLRMFKKKYMETYGGGEPQPALYV